MYPHLFAPITVGTMKHPRQHILGDAYAPRRLVFATRQAYALAELLVR